MALRLWTAVSSKRRTHSSVAQADTCGVAPPQLVRPGVAPPQAVLPGTFGVDPPHWSLHPEGFGVAPPQLPTLCGFGVRVEAFHAGVRPPSCA